MPTYAYKVRDDMSNGPRGPSQPAAANEALGFSLEEHPHAEAGMHPVIDVVRQPLGGLLTSPGTAPKRRWKQPHRNLGVPREFGIHRGVRSVGPLPPEPSRLNRVEPHERDGNWTHLACAKPAGLRE